MCVHVDQAGHQYVVAQFYTFSTRKLRYSLIVWLQRLYSTAIYSDRVIFKYATERPNR